jgi:hypothetical protein
MIDIKPNLAEAVAFAFLAADRSGASLRYSSCGKSPGSWPEFSEDGGRTSRRAAMADRSRSQGIRHLF